MAVASDSEMAVATAAAAGMEVAAAALTALLMEAGEVKAVGVKMKVAIGVAERVVDPSEAKATPDEGVQSAQPWASWRTSTAGCQRPPRHLSWRR